MIEQPDGKFRLTWNLPAKKQWFDPDSSHVRISVRDGLVMFRASNRGGKDAIPIIDRTRGGIEGGKEAYVAGANADDLLAKLRDMGWSQKQPFFMLDKCPTAKDWFCITGHHGGETAPAKFHPHLRLWLPREQPRRLPDAVIDSEVTRLMGPLAKILLDARETVDEFKDSRQIGRPNRDIKQAQNTLSTFTKFVRRVLPDYQAGIPISAVVEANQVLMRAMQGIDPTVPLTIDHAGSGDKPMSAKRQSKALAAPEPRTIDATALSPESVSKPAPKAKAAAKPPVEVAAPATQTSAKPSAKKAVATKSVAAKAGKPVEAKAVAAKTGAAKSGKAKAEPVAATVAKASAKSKAAKLAAPQPAEVEAEVLTAVPQVEPEMAHEAIPEVAAEVAPEAAVEVVQEAPAPVVTKASAKSKTRTGAPEVAAPAPAVVARRRSKPVQADLGLQQPVAGMRGVPEAEAASHAQQAQQSTPVPQVEDEDEAPIRELTVEADPEYFMHGPESLGALPKAVTRRKGWKAQVDGQTEPRARRAG